MKNKRTIQEAFENIWKVKSLNVRINIKDKDLFYSIFLDGYGCAIIDIKDI